MKCQYKYCNNGNFVNKEDAIKINNVYYCRACYTEKTLKQEIEQYYITNLPSTTIQILRKVINQLLYTNKYEAEYILHIVKKIHINKLKINNPFGLTSYCNEGRNIDEWKKIKVAQEFKNIKDDLINYEIKDDQTNYTYKTNNKKWTDLI